jgi:hypothetical protein
MRRFVRLYASVAVLILVMSSAGLVLAALASQPLLKVTRSDDPRFLNEISLNLNGDGDLVTLGVSLENHPVTLQQLRDGFVLNRTKGIETVRLTAEKGFSVKSGGLLKLRYLKRFNLVSSNEYGEFSMDLVREEGRWILRDQHHQDFNHLQMTAHSRGISQVVPLTAGAASLVPQWIRDALSPLGDVPACQVAD